MTGRVPPLNLTEDEIALLRTILQHHADMGMEDDALHSIKEKADRVHAAVYSGAGA